MMKTRCPYCLRLVRVAATRAAFPRLVKHSLPVEKCDDACVPKNTTCHGSLHVVAVRRHYGATA